MAETPGGLTATIRRKLHDGKSPDEIVQELVAGGLGQTSAQRFVDRAIAEGASAPPLPPVAETTGPVDELDQFIQAKTAETAAENAKTGRKSLWVASVLMCSGIAITGFSYIMAAPGQRFTLMWGPVAFGFLLWGKSVLQGFGNLRTFAWFSAVGSIAAPVVLAVVLLGVAAASAPSEEELLRAQIAEAMEKAGKKQQGPGTQTVANRVNANERQVLVWLNKFEESDSPAVQCDAAARLAKMQGEDAVDAVDGLMEHFDDVDEHVQGCIRDAVSKLDPSVKFEPSSR
jgi:hypothetical protein